MLARLVKAFSSETQQRALRKRLNAFRTRWIKRFRRFGSHDLVSALRHIGVNETDTLLVHANFRVDNGFEGTPNDLISCFVDLLAGSGNLAMVSQPFRGYAYDYLAQDKIFDVRKTASMMGLVTEIFRRREGTLRSLHPTHPVLIQGKDASSLIEGHERCRYPCGRGTPFDKLRERGAKILFFDVGTGANTFFHHVEDLVKDKLDFSIYDERLFSARVLDWEGSPRTVETYAFAKDIHRDTALLEAELDRRKMLRSVAVGNAKLLMVSAADVAAVMTELIEQGQPLIMPRDRV